MSRAPMTFRFPDGEELFGVYDGTSDHACSFMHRGTKAEAWDRYCVCRQSGSGRNWVTELNPECTCGTDGEPVTAISDYGGGFDWQGKACRSCLVFLGPYSEYDDGCG